MLNRITRTLPPFNDGADEQSGLPFEFDEYNQVKELWLDHIAAASKAIFRELDLFRMTSIRKGFAGGGFDGGQSLPKRMAVAAQVPTSIM